MNLYDVTNELVGLRAERDAAQARVRELLDLLREVQQELIHEPVWAGPMAPSHVLVSDHIRREMGQKIEEVLR